MAPEKNVKGKAPMQVSASPAHVQTGSNAEASSSLIKDQLSRLTSLFPLTWPIPSPASDATLIPSEDVSFEQSLLLNIDNIRSWRSYMDHILVTNNLSDSDLSAHAPLPPADVQFGDAGVSKKLGFLANEGQRLALRRLTSIYERAIAQFPYNYSLRRNYLALRSRFVLGRRHKFGHHDALRRQVKAGRENLDVGPKLIEEDDTARGEEYSDASWDLDSALDGVIGVEEWHSLAAAFERSLAILPRMPRLWLLYLSIFLHPYCPSTLSFTHARRTFDRALRTLPGSLHLRIWKVYLKWAEKKGGETCLRIWRRYLRVDPSLTERYVRIILEERKRKAPRFNERMEDDEDDDGEEEAQPDPRALEAAKLLLSLAMSAASGTYTSPDAKSPYQLLIEWLELAEKYPEDVGMDPQEEDEERRNRGLPSLFIEVMDPTQGSGKGGATQNGENAQSNGMLVPVQARKGKAGAATTGRNAVQLQPSSAISNSSAQPSWETDALNDRKLPVSILVQWEGLAKYPDQAGRLWTGLATYYIKRSEFELARKTFEQGMKSVATVRDFTQIFDAYAETSEGVLSYLMEELAAMEEAGESVDEEGVSKEDKEKEVDDRMREFEELMERRPFLVNDVLLRRNPDDVQEWEKRVLLFGDDDEKVIATYQKAIETINPRKTTANHHQLFLNFAKFYEQGGSNPDGETEPDLDSARQIFEKAVTIPFRRVDELAEIWCEYAEMEVRQSNYDTALRLLARATQPPRGNVKHISYHDDSLSVQTRLFKSLKLWSFYIDLEESLGSVESAKAVYDRVLELKIANAQIIVNYAAFLEEHKYFEEAFKVYERGVEAFPYPVAFELWNVYLGKFVKRYGGAKIERARDLFEQALEKCPSKYCKPLLLMYGAMEEEHGLARRAMKVYERAIQVVPPEDRFEMYTFYIAKVAANFGLAATRPIYEQALEALPDRQTAEMCLRFAALERKLGEIDRARAIYAHASQFCDPRTQTAFWKEWNAFEIETGSEDTFREMLRIKRSVQAQFNTDVSYIAASALSAAQKAQQGTATAALANSSVVDAVADPMAQAEANAARTKAAPAGFVAAQKTGLPQLSADGAAVNGKTFNEEEIGGGDDDDDIL
ncbi:protein prenylyltransferase [Tilletiaria anomala UBC 951]|uniref:Pre-mRNA-splicing factor SYF1 n=1 Tax=Tilletiaria anomala (strain ATCC 24038 / CBS 436.72 / UBC 951) TaxID=1037660 RepID=A0A066WDF8_TILAU|nr:protein prenylyltransferase [Tilletiaria anomala UBC 951]KDN51957.1 protein prenylyltransferase [Tilletiaria anomala UBC 951]